MSRDSGIFERRHIAPNEIIVREGEPGNCAYLLQSGAVVVYTEHEGQIIELARLGVGEIFGEMALASDMPRTATVKALEQTNLVVITREVLDKKLARSDSTVKSIIKMLIKRMVFSNKALVAKRGTIEALAEMTNDICDNIGEGLSEEHKKLFEEAIVPKKEALLEALDVFKKRVRE